MRGDASKRDGLACSYDLGLNGGENGAAQKIVDNQVAEITEERLRNGAEEAVEEEEVWLMEARKKKKRFRRGGSCLSRGKHN
jgi:hypothetical protein